MKVKKLRMTIVDICAEISISNYSVAYEGYVSEYDFDTESWEPIFNERYDNRFIAYLSLSHFIRKYKKYSKFMNKNVLKSINKNKLSNNT